MFPDFRWTSCGEEENPKFKLHHVTISSAILETHHAIRLIDFFNRLLTLVDGDLLRFVESYCSTGNYCQLRCLFRFLLYWN